MILGQPLIGLSKEFKFRGVTPDQGEASNRHRLHVLETPLLVNVQFLVSVGSALWSDRLVSRLECFELLCAIWLRMSTQGWNLESKSSIVRSSGTGQLS